jgi:two-component system response regulator FixJ
MRIHIVNDDGSDGQVLAALVEEVGHEVEQHASIDAFHAGTNESDYGCILLNLTRSSPRSMNFLAGLGARVPRWPVVIVSKTIAIDDVITAFRHGVLHCLRHPCRGPELINVLHEAVAFAEARLSEHRRGAAAAAIRLSQREREVLGALAQGEQSKVIAFKLGVSVRTVDMHRANILAKLGARNASQAVWIARELRLLDTG